MKIKEKIVGFARDCGYIIKRHKAGADYIVTFNRRSTRKFIYFYEMYKRIQHLEGDIVECGIGKAKTFQFLALLIDIEEKNRTFWAFDSFQGFPEPTIEDGKKASAGDYTRINEEDVSGVGGGYSLC